MSPYEIRLARPDELEVLQSIHVESRVPFSEIGRTEVFGLDVIGLRTLQRGLDEGALLVADQDGRSVGFGLFEERESYAHLEQLSVLPSKSRRGIGATLLESLVHLAQDRGRRHMTLITYRDIAWNAPFYGRHRFRVRPPHLLPRYIHEYLEEERLHGLDMSHRVAMLRDLEHSALAAL